VIQFSFPSAGGSHGIVKVCGQRADGDRIESAGTVGGQGLAKLAEVTEVRM
jgi:hypothetical protein